VASPDPSRAASSAAAAAAHLTGDLAASWGHVPIYFRGAGGGKGKVSFYSSP